MFRDERTKVETKIFRSGEIRIIRGVKGKFSTILSTMEMLYVGRKVVNRKVIHAFVEADVKSNLDAMHVVKSYQRMFLMVFGRYPRKIPFCAWGWSFPFRLPHRGVKPRREYQKCGVS